MITTTIDWDQLRVRQQRTVILTLLLVIPFMIATPIILLLFSSEIFEPGSQPTIGSIIALLFFLITPAVIGTKIIYAISRKFAVQTFDPLFSPLGLNGSPYFLQGRQYHGTVEGRRVDIYLHSITRQRSFVTYPDSARAQVYFGHVLQMYVEARSQGKLALSLIGNTLPTAGATIDLPSHLINKTSDWIFTHGLKTMTDKLTPKGIHTFHPSASGLRDLTVTTFDESWAEKFCSDTKVLEPARELAQLAPHSLMFSLQVLPSSVKLATHIHKQLMFPDGIQTWLNNLVRFAVAVESAPQPSITFQETPAEFITRTNPQVYMHKAILILVALFVFLGLGFGGLFSLLYLFDQL